MTSFGYYVAAARQEKGWRQSYLAVLLEISGSYVNDIEKGRRYPPGEYLLQRFASALESTRITCVCWRGSYPTTCALRLAPRTQRQYNGPFERSARRSPPYAELRFFMKKGKVKGCWCRRGVPQRLEDLWLVKAVRRWIREPSCNGARCFERHPFSSRPRTLEPNRSFRIHSEPQCLVF